MAQSKKKPRLQKADWIKAATRILAEEGVDGVWVEGLAKRLGVTKGSFYWHFKDREALLKAVLDAWHQYSTRAIIERLEQSHEAPRERLRALLRLSVTDRPEGPGGALDLALRDWARRNEMAGAIVREVDYDRVAYIQRLYQEIGLEAEDAERRAILMYSYVIGERLIGNRGDDDGLEQRRAIGESLLIP